MGTAIGLVMFTVLCASVGGVQGVCNHVKNDDLVEYSCVGGQLSDLNNLPPSTGKIRISNMPIHRITPDTFSMFGSDLWVLGCSHCSISDIEPGSFQHLDNLQHLSLDNNHLTTVKESWFRGLDSLTYLDLNYNSIDTIEDGVFGNLPNLVDMRLSGNRLECLNLAALAQLRELKRMFLSENSEFKCPNAITTFLENRGIGFEKDPEWSRQPTDLIRVGIPPQDYDYYDEDIVTEESTTSLPPHRERLHPTPTPVAASTVSYAPSRLYTTEEVVYRPVHSTQDWRTATRTSTVRYDDSTYDYARRPYVPPTIAPIEVTEPPETTERQDSTTWRSWPKYAESSTVWPPHRNEDKHYTEQPDYFSPPNSYPLAPSPGDRQTSSPYVELVEQTTNYDSNWPERNPSNVQYPPSRPEDGAREHSIPSMDATSVTPTVRTVPLVIVHPASPDNVFQPPYYEHPVTVHSPPSMVNQPQQEELTPSVISIETTTDKPLPNCSTNLSSSIRSPIVTIFLSIFLLVTRHVLVEGF